MKPARENRYRATVTVEGWIYDELVIKGDMDGSPDLKVIIGLQELLETVIECSITRQYPGASRCKEILMLRRDRVERPCKTHGVIGAIPERAFHADTH